MVLLCVFPTRFLLFLLTYFYFFQVTSPMPCWRCTTRRQTSSTSSSYNGPTRCWWTNRLGPGSPAPATRSTRCGKRQTSRVARKRATWRTMKSTIVWRVTASICARRAWPVICAMSVASNRFTCAPCNFAPIKPSTVSCWRSTSRRTWKNRTVNKN